MVGLLHWALCSVLAALSCCPHGFICYIHPSMHQVLGTHWKWKPEFIKKMNGFLFLVQSIDFFIAFKIILYTTSEL